MSGYTRNQTEFQETSGPLRRELQISFRSSKFANIVLLSAAVRLGRCPKKEKPHVSLMVALPQDDAGSIDLERQSSLEQMVLHIHESFQKASIEFYRLVQPQSSPEVRRLRVFSGDQLLIQSSMSFGPILNWFS